MIGSIFYSNIIIFGLRSTCSQNKDRKINTIQIQMIGSNKNKKKNHKVETIISSIKRVQVRVRVREKEMGRRQLKRKGITKRRKERKRRKGNRHRFGGSASIKDIQSSQLIRQFQNVKLYENQL